jgi:hypothetical protein
MFFIIIIASALYSGPKKLRIEPRVSTIILTIYLFYFFFKLNFLAFIQSNFLKIQFKAYSSFFFWFLMKKCVILGIFVSSFTFFYIQMYQIYEFFISLFFVEYEFYFNKKKSFKSIIKFNINCKCTLNSRYITHRLRNFQVDFSQALIL